MGMFGRGPRVEFEWDDKEWRGPGQEPSWFRRCSPRVRQQAIDALARKGQWKGKPKKDKTLSLRLTSTEPFGCKNIAHFAVALADLDCTVRVTEPVGYCHISKGHITWPGNQGLRAATVVPTPSGQPIVFDVTGPDAEKALPVIRKTFQEGLKDHLVVMRKYTKLNPKGALPG